jgi:hypothetical protein
MGKGNGKIGQMKAGDFGRVKCDDNKNSEYHPIPLTPEWLERCGFVQDRNGWHIPGSQFSLTENLFPCWLDRMLWPGGIPDFDHVSLKYAHQLQNLYFALTGEELNVKL